MHKLKTNLKIVTEQLAKYGSAYLKNGHKLKNRLKSVRGKRVYIITVAWMNAQRWSISKILTTADKNTASVYIQQLTLAQTQTWVVFTCGLGSVRFVTV